MRILLGCSAAALAMMLLVLARCWVELLFEFAEQRPKAAEKRQRAGEVGQEADNGGKDCERGEKAYRLFLCTWRMLLLFGGVFLLARLGEMV